MSTIALPVLCTGELKIIKFNLIIFCVYNFFFLTSTGKYGQTDPDETAPRGVI